MRDLEFDGGVQSSYGHPVRGRLAALALGRWDLVGLTWLKRIFLGAAIFWGLDGFLDLLFQFISPGVVIVLKTVSLLLVLPIAAAV